jgi:hypothetical protein
MQHSLPKPPSLLFTIITRARLFLRKRKCAIFSEHTYKHIHYYIRPDPGLGEIPHWALLWASLHLAQQSQANGRK